MIDRLRILLRVGLALVLLAPLGACTGAEESGRSADERPNILFIVTDDQAPWAFQLEDHPELTTARMGPVPSSARRHGFIADSSQLRTPHMSEIATEGAYLVNAYTPTPVCSPSRASLLTSRYGSEVGITDWLNPSWDGTLAGPEPDLGLDTTYVTWTELLQDAGYTTGLVGKWHLGTRDRYHPHHHGYDYFMGFRSGGTSPADPTLEKNGEQQEIEGYTPNILTDHALAFLDRQAAGRNGAAGGEAAGSTDGSGGEPFMLSVHYRAPHAPWLPLPEEDWADYEQLNPRIPNPNYPDLDIPRVKQMMRRYLANVASVDRNVGRLLDRLERLGMSENTVVIFTSDHGYNMGHNGIWHKGNGHWVLHDPPEGTENIPEGDRPNMYDRSLRIPFAVRWPGEIEPGTVVDETVTFLDVYPTIAAIAGVEVPDSVTIRGRNALPLLRGETVSDWDDTLYAEYSTHHQSRTHMRMWRTDTWKLVEDFRNPRRDELYHMRRDPAETTNLYDSTGARIDSVKARFNRRILERMEQIDDPVLQEIDRSAQPSP